MFDLIGDGLYFALAFLLLLGPLVAVHEYGHFWVARTLGVKVLRFSVGFGKPLWTRKGRDGVEYVLAAIPLGGYVKMLDEREGEVDDSERHLAFNNQGVWTRIAIVAAGPGINLVFAVLLLWVVFMAGVDGFRPVAGTPAPGSLAAQAGVSSGDQILTVNGRETRTWATALGEIVNAALDDGQVSLEVQDTDGHLRIRHIDLGPDGASRDPERLLDGLGLRVYQPPHEVTVSLVVEDSPAQKAGLREGDVLLRVDGTTVNGWYDLVDTVQASPGRSLPIELRRDGERITVDVTPAEHIEDGATVGKIGIGADRVAGLLDEYRTTERFGPVDAGIRAFSETVSKTVLLVGMVGKLVSGQANLKHVNGPLRIAEVAGLAAESGVLKFIELMAFLSLTLGIMNLLPVPVLDGGHLLYYLIEVVRGAPLSDAVQALGMRVGMALLAGLMVLAFYNDFARFLGVE